MAAKKAKTSRTKTKTNNTLDIEALRRILKEYDDRHQSGSTGSAEPNLVRQSRTNSLHKRKAGGRFCSRAKKKKISSSMTL